MVRPRRGGELAQRLTLYLDAEVRDQIRNLAELRRVSPGQIVEEMWRVRQRQVLKEHLQTVQEPPKLQVVEPPWRDHPGWRLDSLGRNICTDCGGVKNRVRNQPCKGPK